MKLKSFLSALVLSAVASCGMAPAPALALSYEVCRPTTVNTLVVHRKIQTGETTAEQEIASVQADSELSYKTKQLLIHMYKYADLRKHNTQREFVGAALHWCLEFDPLY